MAGRWKLGKDNLPEWEELAPGVSAPDQVAPPTGMQPPPSPFSGGSTATPNTGYSTPRLAPPPVPDGSNYPVPTNPGPPAPEYPSAPPPPTPVGPWPEVPNPKGPQLPQPPSGTSKPTTPAPPGFDQDKWNDPSLGTSNKYIVGRILAAGGTIEQAAAAVGARVVSPDVIEYPNGERYDVFFDSDNASGQRRVQYTVAGGGSSTPAASGQSATNWNGLVGTTAPTSAAPTLPGVTSAVTSTTPGGNGTEWWNQGKPQSEWTALPPSEFNYRSQTTTSQAPANPLAIPASTSAPATPASDPRTDELYNLLLARATQTLDVGARDPIIAAQVDSYRAEQDRGARNYLAAQAEKRGPTANLQGEARLASERAAQSTGALQAQLMQNELTARRQEIMNALQMMGNLLTEGQRIALQRELGLIDASLRQLQLTYQNNQFLDDLSLRAEDRAAYWDAVRRGLI